MATEAVHIDAKTAQRFREIEVAFNLPPGDVLDSLLEVADGWWADDRSLANYLGETWQDVGANMSCVPPELRRLLAKWRAEDTESGAPVRLVLDAELVEAAERHFPSTRHGSLSGFVEHALKRECRRLRPAMRKAGVRWAPTAKGKRLASAGNGSRARR
jgi:hypothetical protein